MFPTLFTPLSVGPVKLANRIVSSGHETIMISEGVISDRMHAYHLARAEGGVGLIVVQVAQVDPTEGADGGMLFAFDDVVIPGYARLAAEAHVHGTKVFAQLHHGGREAHRQGDGTLPVPVAPSAIPNERFLMMPRELSVSRIREIIDCFVSAADRMRRAGVDGVEIVASHGYLPAQFLNPNTNQRTDEFGGDRAGRSRFLREIVTGVRAAVGSELAVGVRISVDEHSYDGLPAEDAIGAIASLDRDDLIDYVSVVSGSSASYEGSHHIVPSMAHEVGYVAPQAALMKAAVSVPVFVAGRINQPQEAERIVSSGQADACVMTRAMICDPEMPNKAKAALVEDIRACIGCNQACIGHYLGGYPISCIQHPETGRELTYGRITTAVTGRRVLVVGGGPGGLKAAASAAERGHQVELHEAGPRVGGQALLAQRIPGRTEFGGIVTNLEGEARRAGVRIVTNSMVTSELIDQLAPEVVVVATGAVPRIPPLERDGSLPVLTAWEVLQDVDVPRGDVVVVDWRGDWIGVGTAIALALRGRRVTLAATGPHAGQSLMQYIRDEMTAQALMAGVTIIPFVRPYGVDDDTVYLQHVLTQQPVMVDAGSLVLAMGHTCVDSLLCELQERSDLIVMGVGDCLAPRTAEEAVFEGLKAAVSIG